MRKYLILILVFAMLLTGCAKEEYGSIDNAVKTKPVNTKEEGTGWFTPSQTSLEYEFSFVNNGRASLRFPCPKTWHVERHSDYFIEMTAPSDDPYFPGCTFYFHSDLQQDDLLNDILAETETEIKQRFIDELINTPFYINGENYELDQFSPVDSIVIDRRISDPKDNRQISYIDTDAVLRSNLGYSIEGYTHQMTGFSWYGVPGIFTGVVPNDKAGQMNELLLYMMSNMEVIEDELNRDNLLTVDGFKTGLEYSISPIYEEADIRDTGEFESVSHFVCPADTGTGFSDSFISIYECKKEDFKKLNAKNLKYHYEPVFSTNVFGYTGISMGATMTYNYDYDGAYRKWNGQKVPEAAYNIVPDGFSRFNGQAWTYYVWAVESDGYVDIIVLTCSPTALKTTIDAVNVIFDNLKPEEGLF